MDRERVNGHRYLVLRIAQSYYSTLIKAGIQHLAKDELVNQGFLGLVEADDTFDEKRGVDFTYYATKHIEYAICKLLRDEDILEHRVRDLIDKMKKVENRLAQEYGREPTPEQVIAGLKVEFKLDITWEQYWVLKKLEAFLVESASPERPLMAPEASDDEVRSRKALGTHMNDCLKRVLKKTELLIVVLYVYCGFTYRDIVDVLGQGYNIANVRRIFLRSMEHIRDCLIKKRWQVDDMDLASSLNFYES